MTFDMGFWNNFIDKTEENHRKIFGVDMVALAKKYGTPTYILFEKIIEENFKKYDESLKKKTTKNIQFVTQLNQIRAYIF